MSSTRRPVPNLSGFVRYNVTLRKPEDVLIVELFRLCVNRHNQFQDLISWVRALFVLVGTSPGEVRFGGLRKWVDHVAIAAVRNQGTADAIMDISGRHCQA